VFSERVVRRRIDCRRCTSPRVMLDTNIESERVWSCGPWRAAHLVSWLPRSSRRTLTAARRYFSLLEIDTYLVYLGITSCNATNLAVYVGAQLVKKKENRTLRTCSQYGIHVLSKPDRSVGNPSIVYHALSFLRTTNNAFPRSLHASFPLRRSP